MPEGWWSRGVTPHLRSGAAAESARLRRHGNSQEELPCVQGQGEQLGGATPCLMPVAAAGRSNPTPEARGGGWEEPHHVQGVVAAWAQEGLEELSHVEGQERWW